MKFELLDMDNWERKEYYYHYKEASGCTYSLTATIDITNLAGRRLYPLLLWLLTDTVNELNEFRTSLSPDGVGVFETMHPTYTIFNDGHKNFSVIWTEFDKDYRSFLSKYEEDISKYSSSRSMYPKGNAPMNSFNVSMLPWVSFTAFNLNIYGVSDYLLPIFTMGKKFLQDNKVLLPLAIQVHHAVCDGYHVSIFIEKLQSKINNLAL